MKKKNEEAFLKSIVGTLPIKKKSLLRKKILNTTIPTNTKKIIKNEIKNIQPQNADETSLKHFFKIEKTAINKKLKKGKIPIDRKIDFHGMSLLDAEQLFIETIINCYEKNLRCLLFVTGKGSLKKNNENREDIRLYYGKIRSNFSYWVNKEEVKKHILSVERANIEYGGDGAFFVYLRKKKN